MMSDTDVSSKVDWLSVTTNTANYPLEWSKKRKELGRGMLGYDTGVEYDDGRIELCHSSRKDMQSHIIFSGKCIDRLTKQHSISSYDILKTMFTGKVSRLDIAIDVRGHALNIGELKDMFDTDKAVTAALARLHLTGTKNIGETLYIGSPSAKKRLRIYDKAAEMHIKDCLWTRIEYQTRGAEATNLAKKLCSMSQPENLAGKIIAGFCHFPESREWCLVIGHDDYSVKDQREYDSNRWNWLIRSCVPAMAKHMSDCDEPIIELDRLVSAILSAFREKQDKFK
jgi:hypothetical protein